LVSIKFSVGKKKYEVKRGMKPTVFEIWEDGKMINQDPNVRDYQKVLEQQILKMNFRAFTQVVVMGSAAYIPFMKLSPPQRREFIEDLLDIRVFSVMGKFLSTETKATKTKLTLADADITSTKEIIKLIESHIEAKKEETSEKIAEISSNIDSVMADIALETDSVKDLSSQIKQETELLKRATTNKKTFLDLVSMKEKVDGKVRSLLAQKNDYASLTTCSSCNQEIGESTKAEFIKTVAAKLEEYAAGIACLEKKMKAAEGTLEEYDAIQLRLSTLNSSMQAANQKIYGSNLLLTKYNAELVKLEKIANSGSDDGVKLKDAAKKVVGLSKQKKELTETLQIHDVLSVLLQDSGIKSKVIKQYIPMLNKLVNRYLSHLEFFCSFNLDEGFNEVVKSRHRDTFTYDSFSQGEKMRIDFSLMLTWRDIAKQKNSVNTNLMIIDELFDSSMDSAGLSNLLSAFDKMSNTNIFVVSHRLDLVDKFPNTLRLIKKNNFTQIAD
jgi:DNA repair exonuclease SbcCD ATPase subunit